MENIDVLSHTKFDLLALVFLATCELDAFDIFAVFYGTTELGNNPYLALVTFVLSFFSLLILALCALRLHEQYGSCVTGGARTGASIGFLAAVCICVVVLVFSLFGMGVERLMPALASSWGMSRLGAYATIFLGLAASYALAGLLLGGLPWLPKKIMRDFGLD